MESIRVDAGAGEEAVGGGEKGRGLLLAVSGAQACDFLGGGFAVEGRRVIEGWTWS